MQKDISKNSILLGLFAIATAAVVAATFLGTKDTIKNNIRMAEEKALIEIVPKSKHNNNMLDDNFTVSDSALLGLRDSQQGFIAKQDGKAVAVLLPVTARNGYSGDIHLLVGINTDGSIAGVRVVSHRETPGLGDKIELKKSQWLLSFNGKQLTENNQQAWQVKKDGGEFDEFTGATITPRAVVQAVKQALEYYHSPNNSAKTSMGLNNE